MDSGCCHAGRVDIRARPEWKGHGHTNPIEGELMLCSDISPSLIDFIAFCESHVGSFGECAHKRRRAVPGMHENHLRPSTDNTFSMCVPNVSSS